MKPVGTGSDPIEAHSVDESVAGAPRDGAPWISRKARRGHSLPRLGATLALCAWLIAVASPSIAQQNQAPAPPLEAPQLFDSPGIERAVGGPSDGGAGAGDRGNPDAVRSVLPALALPDDPTTSGLAAGVRVFVHGYDVVGCTVLGEDEIQRITAPYVGRPVSYADLQQLRDELTRAYVSRGYATSGAVLPEQSLRDGRVRIEVQEGDLDQIDIETDGRLRPSYVERRIRQGVRGPMNVYALETRLQLLQQDPRVRAVRARLEPGGRRGEARLRIALEEERAFSGRLELDNGLSPSIGAERSSLTLAHQNLTGFGDSLRLSLGRSRGLRELSVSYDVPLTAEDTRLALEVRSSASDVVEDPFEALDIESRAVTYGVALRHPIHRTLERRLDLFLAAQYRRSKSFLLGSPFSFSAGLEDGESKLAVLRFGQELSVASRSQALALRSTLSFGIDALGATTSAERTIPDGRFVAWLAQAQYVRRLPFRDAQLIVRGDLQLSNDPLPGLEQFAIGGRDSVRGYRENAVVRDNGAVGSIELRVPVWQRSDGWASIELAPFFDTGRTWNRRRDRAIGRQTLTSVGVGTRWSLGPLLLEVYWADELRETPSAGEERDLQDRGLHLLLTSRF